MGSSVPLDLITITAAARRCGFKNKRSIVRAAAEGRLSLWLVNNCWHVSKAQLREAPILTAGRVAKLARCSTKTVRRRVTAGLITPWVSPLRSRYHRPAVRFTLRDVAVVRGSVGRRVSNL